MKRARWVTEDDIGNEYTIEKSKYVMSQTCAEKDCDTVLFYNAPGGDDDDAEFRVEGCTCAYPALCCTKHVDTFACPKCAEEEEEKE
jgi:hypothetical protein